MNRRNFLMGTAALGGLGVAGLTLPTVSAGPQQLVIQNARYRFRDQITDKLVSLSPDAPPPVLRAKQGQPIHFRVRNDIEGYTAMHWHGLRIANAMDGVPYLTQPPMGKGDWFDYVFTPPDAGTYWYHPHCMTMSQMASGLTGVLVVEENTPVPFDGDQAINLRDFRLNRDDQLMAPYTLRNAARGGTLGNTQTANWQTNPVYDHPAGGLVRLRLVNSDTTRIYKLHLGETVPKMIAWDGHPIEQETTPPGKAAPLLLGPGQRVDLSVLMPDSEGQQVTVFAELPGKGARPMTSLRAVGTSLGRSLADTPSLPVNPIARPDLAHAEVHEFVFGWSPSGDKPNNGYCGSLGPNFWSINRIAWPGDASPKAGPLVTLDQGKSYVFRMRNESPNLHPIHLHGLVFVPLRSNKRTLPPHFTDTMLLLKDEVVDVALVADNPGDWAFHCHVIEHQKIGLTGVIRVA